MFQLVFGRVPVGLALSVVLGWTASLALASPSPGAIPARILRWIDGDTVDVRLEEEVPNLAQRERVRILGINAPELGEPWAAEATRFLREMTMGRTVYLELDRQIRDAHSRLLAHVWVEGNEGWLLTGEELLLAGLARTLFIPPNALYQTWFKRAERLAQAFCRGLWQTACIALELAELEADPVPHVGEAVGVRFVVGRWEEGRDGRWILRAAGSRYGFHAILAPGLWADLGGDAVRSLGRPVTVRGILNWSWRDGPFVEVDIAEQIELPEDWPALPFLHGPYTGWPTATEATVSWTAEAPLLGWVEYAPWEEFVASGSLSRSACHEPTATGRETVHFRLHGLEPGTRYAYRVVLGEDAARWTSPVGTLATPPVAGGPVVFAVISDTQWQWTGVNRIQLVADALATDPTPFQFILHAGDLVESPLPRYWDHLFASLSGALLRAPFLPVLGNHERNSITYYQLFDLPPGGGQAAKRWWALEFGDVVVVGLDTNVTRPQEFHDQIALLRERMTGTFAHRFVVFHHPVFSSDATYGPGTEGLQLLWHPVFVDLGVDIVFTGHAHNYERIERDGVTYLVVGGGGATLQPLAEERLEGSRAGSDDHYFYVRVRTDSEGIHVEAVAVARLEDGAVVPATGVLDRFTLPRD
ncbi:thermonuclease family protein [Candidatus Bipolaricaulota bacterium]|nr:thermonuclease family protein [Candidatus Bipolaricaulota bacterium]